MGHRLAAIQAVVDDDAKSGVLKTFLSRHILRDEEQMAQERLISGRGSVNASDLAFRDDQKMSRRLRIDVVEGEAKVVLISNAGRYFPGDDLGKNGAHADRIKGMLEYFTPEINLP
jgi:hypothetical protein